VIKKIKRFIRHWVLGFLLPRPLIGVLYLPRFFSDWIGYFLASNQQKVGVWDTQPCLGDWTASTPFDPHYFYQGAWLARRVAISVPAKHTDIGSSVLTIGVLSATVETVFVDLRPLKTNLSSLTSMSGNILDLSFPDNTIESLSCLHVIEHIGLGRYGDPLDTQGSLKAAAELQRVLRHGGKLYLSLPIGRERVCFNAHRVHHPSSVLKMFSQLEMLEFSFVDDDGQFHEHGSFSEAENMEYGCGLFLFGKL